MFLFFLVLQIHFHVSTGLVELLPKISWVIAKNKINTWKGHMNFQTQY
jgi:hypothetical protein